MNRIALPALAALLLLPVTGAPAPDAPKAPGKARAPVAIDASLASGHGRVTLRFERAARDVRVEVTGLDGLAVTSGATPVAGASFERGAVATFDVAFTPGSGRSFLRVAVSGDFGGATRASARSFPVGRKSAAQHRKASGVVVDAPGGERVKVLPSGR